MAQKLIPVRIGDFEVLAEATPVAGWEQTARLDEAAHRVVDAFATAQDTIVEVATSTARTIGRIVERGANPESLEVQFGLKFSAQGNVIVAGAAGEATLTVKMTFKRTAP